MRTMMTMALICLGISTAGAQTPGELPREEGGIALAERLGVPRPAVIAHRGASFDAPESTRAAYLLAREQGADYLELDLQRTADGVLVAVHDDTLGRTSDVAERFPDRVDAPVSAFTLEELKSLDAGSWFNHAFAERARDAFAGLEILTLDEVIDIAEGGVNRPGLYIETKQPSQFPGIERELREKLASRGWLAPRAEGEGAVNVAAMPGRVVLQTFEKASLEALQREMPEVPKILLLWLGDGYIPAADGPAMGEGEDPARYYAAQRVRSPEDYLAWLDWAKAQGAIGVGPSVALAAGGEQSYPDLVQPWMNRAAHQRGLLIHPYTVDDEVDFARVQAGGVDGFFTNRTDALLTFYGRPPAEPIDAILERLGY